MYSSERLGRVVVGRVQDGSSLCYFSFFVFADEYGGLRVVLIAQKVGED